MQNEKNKYSKAFGKWLYDYLIKTHQTQQELADALDINPADLSRKIHQGRKFTMDDFIKICNYLGVTDYTEIIIYIQEVSL